METTPANFSSIIPAWCGQRLLAYSTPQSPSAPARYYRRPRALPAPHWIVSANVIIYPSETLIKKNVVTPASPHLSSCPLYTIMKPSRMTTLSYLLQIRRLRSFWRWEVRGLQLSWRHSRFVSLLIYVSRISFLNRLVLKLPAWFPGAGLKRLAIQSQKNSAAMVEIPFNYARERVVSIPCVCRKNHSYQLRLR